jgi:hypothetical protein
LDSTTIGDSASPFSNNSIDPAGAGNSAGGLAQIQDWIKSLPPGTQSAVNALLKAAPQLGGALAGVLANKGGSGSTQVQQHVPWAAAQPWLQSNIASGQELQQKYQQNPFNQQQLGAFSNMAANSDYMRQLASSVSGQIPQRQNFNRGNPSATPQPFQMPQMPPSPYSWAPGQPTPIKPAGGY